MGFLPTLAFWGLDGYFLWKERLFRALYDVRTQQEGDLDYGLDTSRVSNLVPQNNWWRAVFSRTLCLFHGAVLLTSTTVVVITLAR